SHRVAVYYRFVASPLLDVGVPQGANTPNIRLRVSPWIHQGVAAGEGRVLMVPLGAVVPEPPKPVEVGMVKPKDRVGGRNRSIGHRASHPDVYRSMNTVYETGEVGVVRLCHGGWGRGCNRSESTAGARRSNDVNRSRRRLNSR